MLVAQAKKQPPENLGKVNIAPGRQCDQRGLSHGGDRLDGMRALRQGLDDLGPRNLRLERVLDPDWNAAIHRRPDRLAMNDLGSVIGKFNGLREGDFRQRDCIRTYPRVGGQHSIHVRPDPHLVRIHGRTHNRSRVIGAAAS